MTGAPEPRPAAVAPEGEPARGGLRLRLWLGCLAGTLVSIAGPVWLLALVTQGPAPNTRELILTLSAVAAVSLLVGVACALWLDQGIVGRLRGIAIAAADPQLFGQQPPPSPGWGEIADLEQRLQWLLGRHRQLVRSAEDLRQLQRQISAALAAVERWSSSERWDAVPAEEGPLQGLIEALNLGFARLGDVLAQNREAARQVRADLLESLEDARESAQRAERGFVEATALLATARELQRLGTEIQQAMAPAEVPSQEQWHAAVAGAIEELIAASSGSVDHLAVGLLRVREIGEQVHLLANRATLIALDVVVARGRPERPGPPQEALADELRQLAREVRAAAERVDELSRQVEHEVQAASERMAGIRDRVALRLEQGPPVGIRGATEKQELLRLFERVREMTQNATRGGEVLSAAGEHASQAAERVVHRLEDHARDLEGVLVRLSPSGGGPEDEPHPLTAAEEESGRRPPNLRVLDRLEPPPTGEDEGHDREERL